MVVTFAAPDEASPESSFPKHVHGFFFFSSFSSSGGGIICSLSLSLYLCRRMSPSSNYLEWCARASFEEKFLLKNGSLSTKQHKGFWEKHFTSLLFFAAFEKRVRANKESSSYIYSVSYIYREREKRLERFGREKERERIGKTRVVASLRVVVVEKEYIKVRNRSEIRKRYKRAE